MARTELLVTKRAGNGSVAQPVAQNGNVDGHFVDCRKRTTINDDVKPELLTLTVVVSTATTNVTVKAGNGPSSGIENVRGDLVLALPVGTHEIGPFSSGRHLREDGRLWIDVQTPANVTFRPYVLPRVIG